PAETHARAAFAASHAFGEHRIDEQKEGDRLAQGRIVPDVFRQSGGIEDMPEIDGKDRQHDEPGLDTLAEQLDADELAGTGIDGGAHQYGFLEGQPVIHGDGPEENAEGSRRQGNDDAGSQAFSEFDAGHGKSFLRTAFRRAGPRAQSNSADGSIDFAEA